MKLEYESKTEININVNVYYCSVYKHVYVVRTTQVNICSSDLNVYKQILRSIFVKVQFKLIFLTFDNLRFVCGCVYRAHLYLMQFEMLWKQTLNGCSVIIRWLFGFGHWHLFPQWTYIQNHFGNSRFVFLSIYPLLISHINIHIQIGMYVVTNKVFRKCCYGFLLWILWNLLPAYGGTSV